MCLPKLSRSAAMALCHACVLNAAHAMFAFHPTHQSSHGILLQVCAGVVAPTIWWRFVFASPTVGGRLVPALGRSDLTFSLDSRQIRVATPLAPRSVGVKAADQECYSGRNALAVGLQTDRESVKAFEQERGPKTARLQQRRQAGG